MYKILKAKSGRYLIRIYWALNEKKNTKMQNSYIVSI